MLKTPEPQVSFAMRKTGQIYATLWSSEKSMAAMAAMAALTVEPACASLSVEQINYLMVERLRPYISKARASSGFFHYRS
jgi:hypothetical protein